MTKDEALRLALEALEYYHSGEDYFRTPASTTITVIKAALEAKDEPVEFFDWYDNAHWGNEDFKEGCHRAWNAAIKYTAKTNQEAKDEPWSPVSIGVDVTKEGAHVVGIYALDKDTSQIFYAKHHPAPQRTWVRLTDEQYLEACKIAEGGNYMVAFQRIQQWLKRSNT
jgi:hypothetical protein